MEGKFRKERRIGGEKEGEKRTEERGRGRKKKGERRGEGRDGCTFPSISWQ